jgi:hypothetical protein
LRDGTAWPGSAEGMDLVSVILAPVRVPLRLARALDDLAAIAERARRDPDPVEQVLDRLDLALAEIDALRHTAVDLRALMQELIAVGHGVVRVGLTLDSTGRDLYTGGSDLTATGQALEADTRKLIDGGEDLTAVSQRLESHLQIVRAAMPKLLHGFDTVEELEGAVETVAETVEPLQGAAERVGRVTERFSRRRG